MNLLLLDSQDTCGHYICQDLSVIRHLQRVLGAKVGDTVRAGIIDGRMGRLRIERLEAHAVILSGQLNEPPPPKHPTHLVLALPRPKVLRRLIMDISAIGIKRLDLIGTKHTEKSYWMSDKLTQFEAYAKEGLSQGVDTQMPKIELHPRFGVYVFEYLAPSIQNKRAFVAHPYAQAPAPDTAPDVLIVGNDRGFCEFEINQLKRVGVVDFTLGARILRTESAVNALLGRYL